MRLMNGAAQRKSRQELEVHVGRIVSIEDYSDPSYFACVLRTAEGEIKVRGLFLTPIVGLSVTATGYPDEAGPRGRPTLLARSIEDMLPETDDAAIALLADSRLAGYDEDSAIKLGVRFGANVFKVLDDEQGRLLELFDRDHAIEMMRSWGSARRGHHLAHYLRELGVRGDSTPKVIRALHGIDPSPDRDWSAMLKKNPYLLARADLKFEPPLKGAETALARIDTIAREHAGYVEDSPDRIFAGIYVDLQRVRGQGHTTEPAETLVRHVCQELQVRRLDVERVIEDNSLPGGELRTYSLRSNDRNRSYVSLTSDLNDERNIAASLMRLRDGGAGLLAADNPILDKLPTYFDHALSDEQVAAMRMALTSPLSIVCGAPGTGKTTIIKGVALAAREAGARIRLVGTTGRAAKRMSSPELAPAETIARCLGMTFGGVYGVTEKNPLDFDLVIADECSMLDNSQALALLKALPTGARLLLVGDADQLPSVSPGNVLNDIENSGLFPITQLRTPYRHNTITRPILDNAQRILNGDMPVEDDTFLLRFSEAETLTDDRDHSFDQEGSEETFANEVRAYIARMAKIAAAKRVHIDRYPFESVQVLSTQQKGPLGYEKLNETIQQAINPPAAGKAEIRYGDAVFRVGDRVMQTRNDYRLDLMNGDIGYITAIDKSKTHVDVDGKSYEIPRPKLRQLELAYAISIHKSQGGEYAEVLMPLTMTQTHMLNKNLLYTAVTRARERVILVGSKRALQYGVSGDEDTRRLSALRQCLTEEDLRLRLEREMKMKPAAAFRL
jgi:exodeoxyribonuclease V alpha subunit